MLTRPGLALSGTAWTALGHLDAGASKPSSISPRKASAGHLALLPAPSPTRGAQGLSPGRREGSGRSPDDNSATAMEGRGRGVSRPKAGAFCHGRRRARRAREVHGRLHAGLHGEAVKLCRAKNGPRDREDRGPRTRPVTAPSWLSGRCQPPTAPALAPLGWAQGQPSRVAVSTWARPVLF
jgi:hypothetical protein